MSQPLEGIFGELGISQYLDAFLDQGFDTWETILDITESDLDALGVKLGHRRKLQRRIANSRGLAPDAALVSPTGPSPDDTRTEAQRPESSSGENRDAATTVVQKRKYRRHPKPDENAPERPPSAYVLFSNKMRDDLKGRNLTFTEIAKLVGENWQNLTQAEKEPYESQAQVAKDKYAAKLLQYKKTPEFRKYTEYLLEFKNKYANQSQDKDASKRIRLSETNGAEQNGSSTRARRSDTVGSHSGSEPPPTRQQRLSSTVSNSDSQYAASIIAQLTPGEDTVNSPNSGYFDRRPSEYSPISTSSPKEASSRLPRQPSSRHSTWTDSSRGEPAVPPRNLPSLSDVFEGRTLSNANGAHQASEIGGFVNFPRNGHTGSPGPISNLNGSGSNPPSLKKEKSSAGSISSASSYGFPRTPLDGPLPIHALLSSSSNKQTPFFETAQLPTPDDKSPFSYPQEKAAHDQALTGYPLPHINGVFSGPVTGPIASSNGVARAHSGSRMAMAAGPAVHGKPDADLDGMSALLRAGEIVNRRAT